MVKIPAIDTNVESISTFRSINKLDIFIYFKTQIENILLQPWEKKFLEDKSKNHKEKLKTKWMKEIKGILVQFVLKQYHLITRNNYNSYSP